MHFWFTVLGHDGDPVIVSGTDADKSDDCVADSSCRDSGDRSHFRVSDERESSCRVGGLNPMLFPLVFGSLSAVCRMHRVP